MDQTTTAIMLVCAEADFEIEAARGGEVTIRLVFDEGVRIAATVSPEDATRIGRAMIEAGEPEDPDGC